MRFVEMRRDAVRMLCASDVVPWPKRESGERRERERERERERKKREREYEHLPQAIAINRAILI